MNIYNHNGEFLASKYLEWYYSIIEKAFSKDRKKNKHSYYEAHHVLPKSIFPEYKKEKWNIVLLTAKEHFVCHWLLIKITYGNNLYKMHKAFQRMTHSSKNNKRIFTSIEYEVVRKYNQQYMIENNPIHKMSVLEKRNKTNIQKYGGKSPASSPLVLEKMKHTKLAKYGSCCYNNINKTKETNLSNHGVEFLFQLPEMISHIKYIHNERYGCHYSKTEEYKQRRKITAKIKSNREIVFTIKKYCKDNNITLTKGWWQKSDEDLEALYNEIAQV